MPNIPHHHSRAPQSGHTGTYVQLASWDKISSGVFFLFLASTSVPPSLPSLPLLKFVNKFQKKSPETFWASSDLTKLDHFQFTKLHLSNIWMSRSFARSWLHKTETTLSTFLRRKNDILSIGSNCFLYCWRYHTTSHSTTPHPMNGAGRRWWCTVCYCSISPLQKIAAVSSLAYLVLWWLNIGHKTSERRSLIRFTNWVPALSLKTAIISLT